MKTLSVLALAATKLKAALTEMIYPNIAPNESRVNIPLKSFMNQTDLKEALQSVVAYQKIINNHRRTILVLNIPEVIQKLK